MKKEIVKCDCCRKKIYGDNYLNLTLPIIVRGTEGEALSTHEMEICADCANRFARLYYEIARDHGSTGITGITIDET